MKLRAVAVLSLIGFAISTTPVSAGPVGVQRTMSPEERDVTLAELQGWQTQLGQEMPVAPKGVPLLRWSAKRMQIDGLITRVRNGEPVSSDEIDQALQYSIH